MFLDVHYQAFFLVLFPHSRGHRMVVALLPGGGTKQKSGVYEGTARGWYNWLRLLMKEGEEMPEKHGKETRAIGYAIDLKAGYHRYVKVEGVGECREQFAKMVDDLEKGKADAVIVAGAELLFVDTSPMWMEKFVATVKQHGVSIVDAGSGQEYDLRKSADEVAFRALGRKKPGA